MRREALQGERDQSWHDRRTLDGPGLVQMFGECEVNLAVQHGPDQRGDLATAPLRTRPTRPPHAAARLACELVNVVDGGDHSILTGRVHSTYVSNRMLLVYWNRLFNQPTPVTEMAGTWICAMSRASSLGCSLRLSIASKLLRHSSASAKMRPVGMRVLPGNTHTFWKGARIWQPRM